MPMLWFGVGLLFFRRWLYRHPPAFRIVETLFWFVCVGFMGLILLALLAQAVFPAPPPA